MTMTLITASQLSRRRSNTRTEICGEDDEAAAIEEEGQKHSPSTELAPAVAVEPRVALGTHTWQLPVDAVLPLVWWIIVIKPSLMEGVRLWACFVVDMACGGCE